MDMFTNKVNAVSEIRTDYNADTESATNKRTNYGKTVGNPELSEKAQKYYEELKKKYSNFDFVLVSKDQMANVKANASAYANQYKTVVLIDDEKIERMATDEAYRKQYESILSNAGSELSRLKSQMSATGADVQGYGISVNDNGTLSYFAVLKKSSIEQKIRIEKKHAENVEARKEAAKKAEEEAMQERIQERRSERSADKGDDDTIKAQSDDEQTVTLTAGSLEELIQKLSDYAQNEKLNTIRTDAEKMVGRHIDFKG